MIYVNNILSLLILAFFCCYQQNKIPPMFLYSVCQKAESIDNSGCHQSINHFMGSQVSSACEKGPVLRIITYQTSQRKDVPAESPINKVTNRADQTMKRHCDFRYVESQPIERVCFGTYEIDFSYASLYHSGKSIFFLCKKSKTAGKRSVFLSNRSESVYMSTDSPPAVRRICISLFIA